MQLPQHSSHKVAVWLLATIIIVGSFLLAFLNVVSADDQQRHILQDRATTIAYALDSSAIADLKGDQSDLKKPNYNELKSRLTALRQASGDARTVYLAGIKKAEVFFYVDSEPTNGQYYSPPGESYPEATIAFKNVFSGSSPLVEGPLKDKFGNWISGLAPIIDLKTGRTVAVIGIDVDASSYYQALVFAAMPPVLTGLGLLTVILIYEYIRRRDQQILRLKSELVSIASHELRTPITGIRWATELLLKKTAKTSNQQSVQNIYDNIIHLQAGIEDILQLTHATNNKQKLDLAPHNMTKIIKEVCDTQRLAAQQKKVNLIVDKTWPPALQIICDDDKIKRALHNVVSNAIKYTRDNTEVKVSYKSDANEHRIIIKDHGIGIPTDEQSRVFNGFYRASNAKASVAQGTGLGLYLTRTILAQHKGRIEFSSKQNKGTTFELILPKRR